MTIFYQFAELFATFVEGIIALSAATRLSDPRYRKNKNLIILLILSALYTVLITLLNTWKIFSFFTLAICIFYTLSVTKITSKGNILIRATSTMLSWFFMTAIDYLIFYISVMVVGKSLDISKGINILLSPGTTRSIFIISVKLIQLIIFALLTKIYPRLQLLDKKYLTVLLIISTCSYIVMSIITSFIMSDSILTLQISVIFSLLFIMLSLIATIFAITLNSRYQSEKHERHLMEITNQLMEKNFKTIQSSQNIIRQQVHDFKNHIRTINGMLDDGAKAKKYTDELLSASYTQAQYCNCENEVINSIINCKMADAKSQSISFSHSVLLTVPIHIPSIDICAILSNQIDNAIEACEKMPPESQREIKVEIWQKESFLFFKVTNTTDNNPFNDKNELISTKADTAIHGFGVRNIHETVLRHNGDLMNNYKNGIFTSVAVVVNTE